MPHLVNHDHNSSYTNFTRVEETYIAILENALPARWLRSLQTVQWHCRKFQQWGSWQIGWHSEHQQGQLHCPQCQHRCHRRGLKSQQWVQHQTRSSLKNSTNVSSSRLAQEEENISSKMTSDLEAKCTCMVVLWPNSLWSRTREVLNDRKWKKSFTTTTVAHVMQNLSVVKKLKKKHLLLTHNKYTKISLT